MRLPKLLVAAVLAAAPAVFAADRVAAHHGGCHTISDPRTTANRCGPDPDQRQREVWQSCQQTRSGDFVVQRTGWRSTEIELIRTEKCYGMIIARGTRYKW